MKKETIEKIIQPISKNIEGKPNLLEEYFFLTADKEGMIVRDRRVWNDDEWDNSFYENGNCYLDHDMAIQVALDINLNQLLMKFACNDTRKFENQIIDDEGENVLFGIYFDIKNNLWNWRCVSKGNISTVYFLNLKSCKRAISEVVIPFCKKHPEYRFNKFMKGDGYEQ